MELIREDQRNASHTQRSDHIASTYGKYRSNPSLIEALLDERTAEAAREELARRLKLGPEKSGALDWREIREDW